MWHMSTIYDLTFRLQHSSFAFSCVNYHGGWVAYAFSAMSPRVNNKYNILTLDYSTGLLILICLCY